MQIFLTICGAIITVGGAATIISKIIDKQKKPDKDRDAMIKKHSDQLDNDNKRLQKLEEDDRLILESLLALMSHELDGNHTDELRKVHDKLKEHLVTR
jgi:hypothetical protein